MATSFALDVRAVPHAPTQDLDPRKIEFGRIFTPTWLSCEYRNGKWGTPVIDDLKNISLHPAAIVLHYGQAIFEGLKAHRFADGTINLFRPERNARRFNQSARRMSMPEVDETLFVEGIKQLINDQRDWVPGYPGSLYIRPAMIGTEPCIGVRASTDFTFFVLTLPSGAYFPQTSGAVGAGSVRVYLTTSVGRAAVGGTGNVKAAANYAVTLQVIAEAKKREVPCSQVLFLDSRGTGRVEEMGGMNVFFLVDGQWITPRLTGTMLAGVTRDSILQMSKDIGVPAVEGDLTLDELIAGVQSGKISEAFACGTAATIVGISEFQVENGPTLRFDPSPGPVTSKFYKSLIELQYGQRPDPYGWIQRI